MRVHRVVKPVLGVIVDGYEPTHPVVGVVIDSSASKLLADCTSKRKRSSTANAFHEGFDMHAAHFDDIAGMPLQVFQMMKVHMTVL